MRQAGIVPAEIDFSDPAAPRAPAFGDVYHARDGAAAQAEHVFLRGNGLPARWRDRGRFVILETGFGLGHNFLAAWAAWRTDPRRCGTLWFASIDKHPPTQHDLRRAHGGAAADAAAAALADAWPPLLPGLHPIAFEQGRVRLLLGFGDAQAMLRELVLQADAVFLDGFAPSCNPQMWDRRLWQALPRLLAPGATAATWSVARTVRDGLVSAGFEVRTAPGFGGKREMTIARHAGRHLGARPVGRRPHAGGVPKRVLVIGAGLAGASAAHALARFGCECLVADHAAAPASAASGHRAGLFHGLVQGAGGAHARLLRAAALHLRRTIAPWIASGEVEGAIDGLLRLEPGAPDAGVLRARSEQALGFALPHDWAQAVDPDAASRIAGLPIPHAGWFTAAGGWLAPRALVGAWLTRSGATMLANHDVGRIERTTTGWCARNANGNATIEADAVVLANAADAAALAAPGQLPMLHRIRGQVALFAHGSPLPRPELPLAGSGYMIALPEGGTLAGASAQPGDPQPAARPEDTEAILRRLETLLGAPLTGVNAANAQARVAWRCSTADRLPAIGPLPAAPRASRAVPVRHVPRTPGLYALIALGSRGITLAPLAGELLAAWITGAPMPVEASLVDAVDAAREVAERGGSGAACHAQVDGP